jgi:transposase InsO family protein
MTSNRNSQFTSSVWTAFTHRLGVKMQMMTPYHPKANGAIETFHRWLKDSLRARLAGSGWHYHLPWVLLRLRASPREDSVVSAAKLAYGSSLSLLGQFLTTTKPPPTACGQQLRSSLSCVSDGTDNSRSQPVSDQALQVQSTCMCMR